MTSIHQTCWTVVRGAADGDAGARHTFADTYLGIVRGFLAARWRGTRLLGLLDDAVQEVFLDLFRGQGALSRLDPERAPSFRAFLFGVARNVALRVEQRAATSGAAAVPVEELPAPDQTLSRQFDRAWAGRILQLAAQRQRAWARPLGADAMRRVELLELRFTDGLAIRAIAERWGEAPERVHREYAKAREEFKQALRAELQLHVEAGGDGLERACLDLLAMLS